MGQIAHQVDVAMLFHELLNQPVEMDYQLPRMDESKMEWEEPRELEKQLKQKHAKPASKIFNIVRRASESPASNVVLGFGMLNRHDVLPGLLLCQAVLVARPCCLVHPQ